MKRLIVFLMRKRFKLKKHEYFQFVGQKTENVYYFDKDRIVKMMPIDDECYLYVKDLKGRYKITESGVSFNWLLNKDCVIRKVA